MARPGPKASKAPAADGLARGQARGASSELTRSRLLDAALATLIAEGYAGASARAVAGRAGCNQAVIYYHFGSVDDLLVQAVTRSGQRRLDRYREALDGVTDPSQVLAAWRQLHREDIDSGHIPALVELLGGVAASPALRAGLGQAMESTTAFVTETVSRVVDALDLGQVVPLRAAVDLLVSLFVGVELLTHLDGQLDRPDRLFAAGVSFAEQVGPLVSLLDGLRGGEPPQRP
jgi:AcrR family transcriptional regulator